MSLEHYEDWEGDWMIDAPSYPNSKVRLYHLHKQPDAKWKILSAVIDGKCRTCNAEAPKALRFRVAFWGVGDVAES